MNYKLFIFLLLVTAGINNVLAQWISLGPNSGNTKSLYFKNGILYTGLNDIPYGIYYSTDAGQNWNQLGELIADVWSMLKVGNTFYATGRLNSNYVYFSTDNGITWNFSEAGSLNNNMWNLTSLGTDIFVASDEGIFKSTDEGISWNSSYSSSSILSVINSGTNLVAGGNGGIFTSIDGGANWLQTSSFNIQSLFAYGNYILGTNTQAPFGVIVSSDNGNTWNNYTTGLPLNTLVYDCTIIGSDLYCVTYPKSIYKSTDNGQTWSFVGDVTSGLVYPERIATDGTDLYSCYSSADTDGGVYKSTDGGLNWMHAGLRILDVTALGSNSTSVYYSSYGFGRSDDDGNSWVNTNNYLSTGKRIFLNNNDIFVCTGIELSMSTDNGYNFNTVIGGQVFDIINVSGNLFATTFFDVWKSTDDGSSWNTIPSMYQNQVGQFAFINNTLIAASRSFWVELSYFSTDEGNSWIEIADTAFTGISAVHVLGNLLFASNTNGIIKSIDNGINWTYASTGFPGGVVTRIISYNGKLIAAGSFGVYFSANNGDNWHSLSQGLPAVTAVKDITIKDGWLYAAVYTSSIWKRDISMLSETEKTSNDLPDNFGLLQNYPNPFNPSTMIRYSIPQWSNVTLKVYDILGKEITTLVNEEKSAGFYEINFNASQLASGIYYYQLKADNFIETRKLMLIK